MNSAPRPAPNEPTEPARFFDDYTRQTIQAAVVLSRINPPTEAQRAELWQMIGEAEAEADKYAPRPRPRGGQFTPVRLTFTSRPSAPATVPAAPPTPLWERVLAVGERVVAWLLALLPLTGMGVLVFLAGFYVTCFVLGHRP